MVNFSFALLALVGIEHVNGHGYVHSPRSRNWFAVEEGVQGVDTAGLPDKEYCPDCLNTNELPNGICGKPAAGSSYTEYLDSYGNEMPWISQETYTAGQQITVKQTFTAHHYGHVFLSACDLGKQSKQDCFDNPNNWLEFVNDNFYNMPKDNSHPERGYLKRGFMEHEMVFKLPDNVSGDQVLIQWRYITANSCLPEGYHNYFNSFIVDPNYNVVTEDWKGPNMQNCDKYPQDGSKPDGGAPEQFWNCVEVTINPGTPTPPPVPTPPTPPPTASPVSTPAPVPIVPNPSGIPFPCCSWHSDFCDQPDNAWCHESKSNCEGSCSGVYRDPYSQPPPTPTGPNPTTAPVPVPPTASPPTSIPTTGIPCCSDDFKRCINWVDNNEAACLAANYYWLPWGAPVDPDSCIAITYSCVGHGKPCCPGMICNPDSSSAPCIAETSPPVSSPTSPPVSMVPVASPTPNPTASPIASPTANPTNSPIANPTSPPIGTPTRAPTPTTPQPTNSPIDVPAFDSTTSEYVRVNQVGYLSYTTKIGVIVDASTSPLNWQIQNTANIPILTGATTVYGSDGASGDHVHQADFSALSEIGTYKLVVDGIGGSLEFDVAPSLYTNLPHEAMNYFYFHRMGVEVKAEHLIDDRYARAAIHPADTSLPAYNGWCETCDNFDLFGSWADAGDYGIYTVNHAISAWTLLNLHEKFPDAFSDGTLNIPESGNNIADVLDETNYGSRFMRGMLPSDGGLASHKAHNHAWSAFVITVDGENGATRSVMGPSTAATYAVARVNAQLARMYNGKDNAHRDELWSAAVDAWTRADGTNHIYNPSEASPGPAVGGGDYPDSQISDDRYAAAVEMYLAAYHINDENVGTYKSAMQVSPHYKTMGQWDWATVAGAGTLSLYSVDNDLSTPDKVDIESNIVAFADNIKAAIDGEGYPSNLDYGSSFPQYPWGSNSFIMNRAIALAYAYEVSGDASYQDYIMRTMDYIMGVNAMDISYITGYGEKAETDTHDRWAWTIGQDAFWPKGWLSGGPNNELINDYETPGGVAAAKSYAGPGTAPHAWGSKENTVNWNAPLAWVAWYIENKIVPNLGGCDGNCPPQASSMTIDVQMDEAVALILSASDYDGSIVNWEIIQSPSLGTLSGTAPLLTYTPYTSTKGVDTFKYQVTDNAGAVSEVAVVTLQVRDCDLIEIFDVPRAASYPVNSRSEYAYVHVSEGGPNLGDVTKHVIQYTGTDIYEFSLSMTSSPFYKDLKQCMSPSLNQANPSFTLSGCAYNDIDGEYWINQSGDNEIWVEKNNRWAIVWSNSDVAPEFCSTGTSSPAVTPPPVITPTFAPVPAPTTPPTPSPTPSPTTPPTLSPVVAPTLPPQPVPGCYSKDYKNCLPDGYGSEANTCGTVWLPDGERTNCVSLWGKCNQNDDCCGESVCFGGTNCVPPSNTPAPTPACIICDDVETTWMTNNGKDCTTSDLIDSKCNKDTQWIANKFCQLSCYNAGYGYPGDVCCSD